MGNVDSASKYGIDHQKEAEELIFELAIAAARFGILVLTICGHLLARSFILRPIIFQIELITWTPVIPFLKPMPSGPG